MIMSPLSRFKLMVRRLLPEPLIDAYHFCVAISGALIYGFPSRRLMVVGVTGTKGKSSTVEMIGAIAETHGWKVALLDSIRIKIGVAERPNTMRMSMPGRFYIQRFFSQAREQGCDIAVIEMTSEGSRQFRHRGIALDALVFTNLAPEHIESHGSYEKYAAAKLELGNQLLRSSKRPRIMVSNGDDSVGARFLTLPVEAALPFSLKGIKHSSNDERGTFEYGGEEIVIALPGEFSLKNALAAATVCHALGVPVSDIARGLASIKGIPGRAERIEAGQDFAVVVDYAHTPDSLHALYDAYANHRRICVLGSTGGGRDTWKRPVMGKIAAEMCDTVILTNEDPYDEDPRSIIAQLARGMEGIKAPEIILDRRAAIARALSLAKTGDAVLISGKGTDPTIQGPGGTSIPWSDAAVAREEIERLGQSRA